VRYLGVDVGERRIGLAISDPNGQVAVPLRTLHRTAPDGAIEAIGALVVEESVDGVVVGLPLSLDGSTGPQAESVQEFVRELLTVVKVPVTLWDERLSTVQAEELLRSGGLGWRKRKAEQDSLAAAIILQGYLDSRPQK